MNFVPWKEVVELGGFIIGLLAVGLAFKQFIDAREHTQKLKALVQATATQQERMNKILANADDGAKRLQILAESLPTRFIGTFPSSVARLADFISAAKHDLVILCDFAGYGSYSDPKAFTTYFQEMRRRRLVDPIARLRLVLYSRAAGDEALPLQFKASEWDALSSSPEFSTFYALFGNKFPTPPRSFKDWNAQSWDIEEDYRQALLSCGVELRIVAKPAPVFVWIRDNEEAIISFQSSAEFNDFTFRTSDIGFIEFFRKQFDNAYANGLEYQSSRHAEPPLLVS